jgi:hypothetical protein
MLPSATKPLAVASNELTPFQKRLFRFLGSLVDVAAKTAVATASAIIVRRLMAPRQEG